MAVTGNVVPVGIPNVIDCKGGTPLAAGEGTDESAADVPVPVPGAALAELVAALRLDEIAIVAVAVAVVPP